MRLVMTADTVRILVHPTKGETLELPKEPTPLVRGEWHKVDITFVGSTYTASVDGRTYEVMNDCIAEGKLTL